MAKWYHRRKKAVIRRDVVGRRNLEALNMVRVGPYLWLNLDKGYRQIINKGNWYSPKSGEYSEYAYYKAIHKKKGSYMDGRGGWKGTRLLLLSGFCFEVSDRVYSKYEMDVRTRRKNAKKEA